MGRSPLMSCVLPPDDKRPGHHMLWQVRRFRRRALAFLRATDEENLTTYGGFLERQGFSGYFIAHYAVPVVSCVWSAGRETTLAYPARRACRSSAIVSTSLTGRPRRSSFHTTRVSPARR
jgi:predicted NAD/FAD-binding protein